MHKMHDYVRAVAFFLFLCNSGIFGSESPFGNLKNMFVNFESFLNEVNDDVSSLLSKLRSAKRVMDSTVEEDCLFECEEGYNVKKNPNHDPTKETNGCGAFGLENYLTEHVLPMTELVDCCNLHDICYSTCGSDKDLCDLNFKKCLYGHCRTIKKTSSQLRHTSCLGTAKLLSVGTMALGCPPFIKAQEEACSCVPSQHRHSEL